MNNELGKNSLSVLFSHYKNSFLYPLFIIVIILVVCFFLVVDIIIPQYQRWFSIQDEVAQAQAKIDVINKNIHFMEYSVLHQCDDHPGRTLATDKRLSTNGVYRQKTKGWE